ncbi:conserved hypothetical protein [Methylobacterium sp. 4-46]|uniref:hypothetical protein n=1 Tax=unclassified Methylobacterium TaxID=2615210 RepID=UPI000152D56C|nr:MULTISPECIES: hypothetical protein [Methylobacterium]ACA19724.1 conserved hypothetical protein [Methylobacterium sp. 4-46]WFT78916.1 hypothetical protein QA634_27245 [Methylobacterium nodulans]
MTRIRGRSRRGRGRALAAIGAALLSGCGGNPDRAAPAAAIAPPAPPAYAGPVLAPDGTCTGPVPAGAAAIAPGIGECELVRLKGAPPTDVLVGESGRGQREVQVLYAEPGGKELYFFVNNRLDRIVK